MAKVAKKVIKKRRDRKNVEAGHAHISSTFNNTIITITDVQGNTIAWSSSGGQGFSWDERIKPFKELKPEMASFDAGTMNWLHTVVFMNEPGFSLK